ncbi:MAG: GNAT family N-acetyltransferase [Alphaproteobacteria bacterium]
MNAAAQSFDPEWEEKYANGHSQRYAWDVVVSFVFRNARQIDDRKSFRILDIGCGTGGNVAFAASEGFDVSGCDASASAIETAQRVCSKAGLSADLRVADFTSLPFEDASFDLAIDRCSITCCGYADARKAVAEAWRVLKPGGKFLFNVYSREHSSAHSGAELGDGIRSRPERGTLAGIGQVCFYGVSDLRSVMRNDWVIRERVHLVQLNDASSPADTHAEWRLVLQKPAVSVDIRKATLDDAGTIFEWRNNPKIIERGAVGNTVTWDEHLAWLTGRLAKYDSRVFIIEEQGEPIGVLRFDGLPNACVSIYLDPDKVGSGRGVAALLSGCRLIWDDLSPDRIVADVLVANDNARRAFLKAGFIETGETDSGKARVVQFMLGRP